MSNQLSPMHHLSGAQLVLIL